MSTYIIYEKHQWRIQGGRLPPFQFLQWIVKNVRCQYLYTAHEIRGLSASEVI